MHQNTSSERQGAEISAQEAARTYCQQLVPYIQDAAQLLLAGQQACNMNVFMAEYLSSVVSGQHVLWRHYAYVAATHHNRKMFLGCARRSLAPAAAAGRLSLGDVHSLLQLLCPDFPVVPVKNAWSPAVAIQTWQDHATQAQQQHQQQPQDLPEAAAALVHLPIFLQCLEVTFMYEHYLLELRNNAFTREKKCVSLDYLDAVMTASAQQLPGQGWPVPNPDHMKRAVMQASRARTYPDFAFAELIKSLCCSQEVVLEVRRDLLNATAAAAAAAAANTIAAQAERSTGSSDDSLDEDGLRLATLTAVFKQQQADRDNTASARPTSTPWR